MNIQQKISGQKIEKKKNKKIGVPLVYFQNLSQFFWLIF